MYFLSFQYLKQIRPLFILAVLSLFISSCEDTDCIYADKRLCDPNFDRKIYEGLVPFSEDLSNYQQRHLLEDFTGFLCTNCPAATSMAVNLKNQYPERLTVVGVHCTFIFAAPATNDPDEPFYKDFRTEEGEIYHEILTNSGPLPNGIIDRVKPPISASQWTEKLAELMAVNEPAYFLRIKSLQVSADSSSLVAKVLVKPLNAPDIFTRYTLNLGLMENGIEEAQKDVGGVTHYDYIHNHVFRGNSHGPWGIYAFDSETSVPTNQAMQYSLTLALDTSWNLANCEAFVYISEEDTHQIVQIEEAAVAE